MTDSFLDRELRVVKLIATKKGDEQRGPAVWINPDDAKPRMLTEGELAWIYGTRRHELAEVHFDAELRIGDVVLRDIAGSSPSETVRVVKPDLDTPARRRSALA